MEYLPRAPGVRCAPQGAGPCSTHSGALGKKWLPGEPKGRRPLRTLGAAADHPQAPPQRQGPGSCSCVIGKRVLTGLSPREARGRAEASESKRAASWLGSPCWWWQPGRQEDTLPTALKQVPPLPGL